MAEASEPGVLCVGIGQGTDYRSTLIISQIFHEYMFILIFAYMITLLKFTPRK